MEPSDSSGEQPLRLFSIQRQRSGAPFDIRHAKEVASLDEAGVFARSRDPSETPYMAIASTRVLLNSGFAHELRAAIGDPGLSGVRWLSLVSDGLDLSGRLVQHGNFLDDPATPSLTPLRAAYWADPAVAVIDVARLRGLELDPGTPQAFSELLDIGRTTGLATLVSSRLRFSFGGERSDYLGEWPQRPTAPSSNDNTEWLSTVRPDPSITVAVRTTASRPGLLARNLAALSDAHAVSPASEVLIVSSASADRLDEITIEATPDIADLPLRTVHAPVDGASSRVAAMTAALAAAQSDYVWFVDDDDWATPRGLAIIKGAVHATDRPIVVAGSDAYRETWDHETRSESLLERHYHSAEWYRAFTGWNFLPVCSIVMPRELALDRIAVNPPLRDLGEDYFIQLLLYTAPGSSVAVAPETIANISLRTGSDSAVTMEDRTPWFRDLSSYMSDLSSDPNASTAAFWALGRAIREIPYPPEPGSGTTTTDATPAPAGDAADTSRHRASRLWKRLRPDAT